MEIKKEEILKIISEIRPEFDFSTSDNFIDDGYLDSFDVIAITDMLEERYGIKIDGMDIVPENYDTVEHIIALINKNRG